MKRFIIIINLALGGLLIFYGLNSALFYARTQSFGMAMILNVILGTFVIVAALAFRKDMRWALVALPLVPLALGLWLVYRVYSVPVTDVAWTGGIMMMAAIVLFVVFVFEGLYVALRRKGTA